MNLNNKGDGVYELRNVGYGDYHYVNYKRVSRQTRFNALVKSSKCKTLIASLTTGQQGGARFLLKNGFKRIGASQLNPNSGNRICVYVKDMTQKKKAKKTKR